MSKQTAVEWLKEELEQYGSSSHLSLDWSTFDELVEQAKAMEREQIHAAFDSGVGHVLNPKGNPLRYYEETYK